MSETIEVGGRIWAVFAHRLAIEGPSGRVLADLGPKGAEGLALKEGDAVTVRGTRKPSEIKVSAIVLPDGTTRAVAWKEKDAPHREADPAAALAAVQAAGYALAGEVRSRPKHFEIPARKGEALVELHVGPAGDIRKVKPSGPAPGLDG